MKRSTKLFLGVVGLGVVAAAGGVIWWLQDDAPPAVDIETAASGVGAGADFDGDVSGGWTVDAESGEFDYDSATGTFAGFRIDEELASIGAATAVGRTGDVSGSIDIEGSSVTAVDITVDLSTLTTDKSRRDRRVHEALDTGQYPTASFVLTEPIELGDAADAGTAVSTVASGDLTIHGTTNPVEFPLDAQLVGGTLAVVGSLDIALADYGVSAPQSPTVLSVSDQATVELQLLLTQAQ